LYYLFVYLKSFKELSFMFISVFPEMFCKDKAFISNYQKIIELFFKTFLFHLCSSNHLVSFKLTSLAKRMQK